MAAHGLAGRFRDGRSRRPWAPAAPSGADAPQLPLREIVHRFWPATAPYRGLMALSVLLAAIGPVFETATIALYGLLVDDVLAPRDLGPLPAIAGAYVGLTVLGGVVGFARSYLAEWIAQHLLLDLRLNLFDHLHRLPLEFFDRRRLGDTVTRLTDDVDGLETLLVSGITSAITYLLKIVLFAGALFVIDARLALVALVVAPPFWVLSRRFAGRIKGLSREQRHRDGMVTALAEESLANAALVQAYNRQETERRRFETEARANLAAQLALTRLRAFFAPLGDLIELGGVLVVVGAGAVALSEGRISLGGLLVFLAYLSQLYGPVRGLSRLATSVFSASAAAERVIEVLDAEPRVRDPEHPIDPVTIRGEVVFDRVTYRYPGAARDALADVSFKVAPGEVVALVGPSGAGKSTVARLLARFDDPQRGRIVLDGHDLRAYALATVRDNVTLLLQETLLFAGTVRDAIGFGKPGASDAEIESAAVRAGADGFVTALPGGFDAVIGEKGRTLSGGQRQRLAIARAMLRGAPVLVLDEPTTGLDPETGARVLAPLREAGERAPAVILITHNLASARAATRIVVLDRGRVVEQGRHDDLLAANGHYARLWRSERAEANHAATAEPATA